MKITTAEILQILIKLSVKPHKKSKCGKTASGVNTLADFLTIQYKKKILKRTEEEMNYF